MIPSWNLEIRRSFSWSLGPFLCLFRVFLGPWGYPFLIGAIFWSSRPFLGLWDCFLVLGTDWDWFLGLNVDSSSKYFLQLFFDIHASIHVYTFQNLRLCIPKSIFLQTFEIWLNKGGPYCSLLCYTKEKYTRATTYKITI